LAKQTVILVRHAQSEHHVRGLSGGWTDTPLTELGHRQAHAVAQRLKAELSGLPVRLFTSDLLRTQDTARHIAEALNLEPIADPRLREFNNGDAAGLTIEEARRRFPEPARPWHPDHRQWPNGETWREFQARAEEFIESLDTEGSLPVVVTHGGTVQALTGAWLRLPPEVLSAVNLAPHVTSITVLQQDSSYRLIERLNDISHLDGIKGNVTLRSLAG